MKRQIIINKLFLSFMILALCAPVFSKESQVASKWITAPVIIDGSNSEWEGDTLTFEKKVGVDYAFRNDSENLYVLFIFKDRKFMSSINKTGMTLWFNTEGKKKKKHGVRFQIKVLKAEAFISLLEQKRGPLPEEEKENIRSKPSYPVFFNEVLDQKGKATIIDIGPTAPAFNSMKGGGVVAYEFRVPLQRGDDQPGGIGTEPGKNLKIGFEWGGMTEEMKKQRLMGVSDSGTGGRADSATGLTRERSRSADSDRSSGLSSIRKRGPKKYNFWADVKLAQTK
jgi:hypothetical protein